WGQRSVDAAAGQCARAISLGGTSERLFLEYARVLGYTNRVTDAIESLGKAVARYPESDEAHYELGALEVRNGNWGAALAQLRAVKKVQPAVAYRYFYNLAYAEYRMGEVEAAKANAAKARKYTRNPDELAALDRLERSLK